VAKVSFRGVTLDSRTRDQMVEVERLVGFATRPTQGSYSRAIGASAGTHAGSGAIDLSVRGLTATQRYRLVKAMRIVGMATWYRPYRYRVWAAHIHGISIASSGLTSAARAQVFEYKNGGDGLAGSGKDPHASMNVPFRTWEQYKAAKSGYG